MRIDRMLLPLALVLAATGCGAIPAAVIAGTATLARDAKWGSMDEIEDAWVARRAERKKVRDQLANLPPDSAEIGPLNERLAVLNTEIAELAKKLDIPQ